LRSAARAEEEGDALVFEITLSNPSASAIEFTPALTNGTATIGTDTGTPLEYSTDGGTTWTTWTAGAITIPAGVTSVLFSVPSTDDNLVEGDETFTLTVTSDDTANASAEGTGTIEDNDTTTIAVSSPSEEEGDALVFEITLSNPSASAIEFTPSLTNVTATIGTDTGTPLSTAPMVAQPGPSGPRARSRSRRA
jgi:hypothetical protein